jgi:hypothetical protein
VTARPPLLDLRAARFQPVNQLSEEGDPPEMTAAIEWLIKSRIPVCRASPFQLKIGPLSFYPGSGTINYDNCRREPVRGLGGLKTLLESALRRELPPIE